MIRSNYARYALRASALSAFMGITAILWAGGARADGVIVHYDLYLKPSALEQITAGPNKLTDIVACYYYNGLWGTPINCNFTLSVSYPPAAPYPAIAETGGHEHGFETRPLVYRPRRFVPGSLGPMPVYEAPQGRLIFPFDQDPADGLRVAGDTMPGDGSLNSAAVEYPLPEVSGEAQVDIQVVPPRLFYCVDACYTKKLHWERDTVHVGVQDLVNLPAPSTADHYVKARNPDTEHPNAVAFYIKKKHLPEFRKLANLYYKFTVLHRALSLNDMTLPLGGLFDINGDWKPPHSSHRDGTDADVNGKINGVDTPCLTDFALIKAARVALPMLRSRFGTGANTDSALLCESRYRRHIDFER